MQPDLYASRGVSAGKEDVHAAIRHLDKGLYPDTFAKVLPDVAGDAAWCSLLHADTAGTKTALAYLYWRETGDTSVWAGIVQDAIVMNLDDMACVGARSGFVLSSTIGRNKRLIPGEVVSALIQGTTAFMDRMRDHGVDCVLAGGETADVGDIVRTADVGFTVLARMPRADVLRIQPQPGDLVVGLSSCGQTTYEDTYNSGIGSNGLTYARHEVLANGYATRYPESFDPSLDPAVVYQGKAHLTDALPGTPLNVGQALLSPTRTYLPFLKAIPDGLWHSLHGIVHNTGGGQTKVLHFLHDRQVDKSALLPVPPLFQFIQQQRDADWQELFRVFNMGQRLELYVPNQQVADELLALAAQYRIDGQVVGQVTAGAKQVRLLNPVTGATYTYEA